MLCLWRHTRWWPTHRSFSTILPECFYTKGRWISTSITIPLFVMITFSNARGVFTLCGQGIMNKLFFSRAESNASVPVSVAVLIIWFQTVKVHLITRSLAIVFPCLQTLLQRFLLTNRVPSTAILIACGLLGPTRTFILLAHAYHILITACLSALLWLGNHSVIWLRPDKKWKEDEEKTKIHLLFIFDFRLTWLIIFLLFV